jgi:hypothetical protein
VFPWGALPLFLVRVFVEVGDEQLLGLVQPAAPTMVIELIKHLHQSILTAPPVFELVEPKSMLIPRSGSANAGLAVGQLKTQTFVRENLAVVASVVVGLVVPSSPTSTYSFYDIESTY